MTIIRAAGRLARRLITREDTVTEQPYDHSHDNADYDPDHPDAQHEQPPTESTDDPADTQPGDGDDPDAGELPGEIPGTDQEYPPGEDGET